DDPARRDIFGQIGSRCFDGINSDLLVQSAEGVYHCIPLPNDRSQRTFTSIDNTRTQTGQINIEAIELVLGETNALDNASAHSRYRTLTAARSKQLVVSFLKL